MVTKNDYVSRHIGGSQENGILSCGYSTNPKLFSSTNKLIFPYYSCFFPLEGRGSYEDENDFHYDIQKDKLVQRFPGIRHRIAVDTTKSWKVFFISFGASSFEALSSLGFIDTKVPVIDCPITPELLLSFDDFLYHIKYADTQALFVLLQRMQKCIVDLITQSPLQQQNTNLIAKAKDLLSSNLEQTYTEKYISDTLCIGFESFRKKFKKEVGISPMSFRNHQRMLMAKKMVTHNDSINEIAESLGYSDAFTFSKQFKRHWGISPNAYKKSFHIT